MSRPPGCLVGKPVVPRSTGPLLPGIRARITDPDTAADLAPGQAGELWVRTPAVMTGYLGNPAASAATIDEDGWLNTGDIARFYADGNLFLLDRLKELIKVKGFEVAPAELEAIHQVPFTDAIPTSVSGKTLRRLLIAGEQHRS